MLEVKIKSNKGVTLVALIATIVVVLILLGISVENIKLTNKVAPYNNMIADITLLEDKILIHYNKYNEIPVIEDDDYLIEETTYYRIDLSKLQNVTLNYGVCQDGDETDIYLVNSSLQVYYLKGIEKDGEIMHKKVTEEGEESGEDIGGDTEEDTL